MTCLGLVESNRMGNRSPGYWLVNICTMLGKYIALYKYYCKVAPTVWRSRGQQCTGKGKHPSLSCGISVIHEEVPGHMREGMGKPRERDPTQATRLHIPRLLHPHNESRSSGLLFPLRSANLLGTDKLGYVVSCPRQKPLNWTWDICGCSQQ